MDRHNKTSKDIELDKVYKDAFNYVKNRLIDESFNLNENNIIPKIKEDNYENFESFRWFLTFNDVKNYLITISQSKFFGKKDNLNEYYKKDKIRRLIRMDNWSIKYQFE